AASVPAARRSGQRRFCSFYRQSAVGIAALPLVHSDLVAANMFTLCSPGARQSQALPGQKVGLDNPAKMLHLG
ncbi:MAG: hypothetical protein WEB63_06405, partial [Cucumibacter sp.]